MLYTDIWAGIAQSVQRLATGWTVGRSNPGAGEIFRTRPDRPWAHPTSYTMGTGYFPGVKRPGRGLDHPPHLTPRLKKKYSCTSTPLWAFGACSRVTFTFTREPRVDVFFLMSVRYTFTKNGHTTSIFGHNNPSQITR
jgi:hypothetical protein